MIYLLKAINPQVESDSNQVFNVLAFQNKFAG